MATSKYQLKYGKKSYDKMRIRVKKWSKENYDRLLVARRKRDNANKDRHRNQCREYYRNHKQKELDRIRFKKYGITGEEFRTLVEKQGLKCPICNRDITKNPSVDHDHVTGKIRGLICNNCNLSVGNAEDSPDRLRAMAEYLERNR
jgi:hypothetical protein